jgi:hypothetical protein
MVSEAMMLLAVFDDIEPAANGIAKIREMGVKDDAINVVSGVPFPARALGRPAARSWVTKIALAGAVGGASIGLFLLYGTAFMYPLHVGGQPIYPIPMVFIAVFETAMLGLMTSGFLGLFVDSGFPSYTPKDYVPQISDGKIAVFFRCEAADEKRLAESLAKLGAESVKRAERRQP